MQVRQRHVLFQAVGANDAGGFGGQAQQLADGPAGLAAGAHLEHLAQEH